MSHDNVGNLRAMLESWNPEDWARGEGMSLLDPEVSYEDTILPDHAGETYRGHEGIARSVKRWLEPFENGMAIELQRIVGSNDPLVAVLRARGTAQHTGIEFDVVYANLCRFRRGKIIYMKTFREPQEALEAAGLSDEDARDGGS